MTPRGNVRDRHAVVSQVPRTIGIFRIFAKKIRLNIKFYLFNFKRHFTICHIKGKVCRWCVGGRRLEGGRPYIDDLIEREHYFSCLYLLVFTARIVMIILLLITKNEKKTVYTVSQQTVWVMLSM